MGGNACRDALMMFATAAPGAPAESVKSTGFTGADAVANCGTTR
jgi:hypothetical protein